MRAYAGGAVCRASDLGVSGAENRGSLQSEPGVCKYHDGKADEEEDDGRVVRLIVPDAFGIYLLDGA